MVAYSSSSIALTIIAGHFVFSSAASSTSAFVPAIAAHRPPVKFGLMGDLPTSMLPRHGLLPLELRRQRAKSQIRSFHTTIIANANLPSEDRQLDSVSLQDHCDSPKLTKWQDPLAVLLSHCVPVLLLGMSLYSRMQVCKRITNICFELNG
jgi:hypothetical protein